jgi:DNA ligase 1
MLYKKLAEVYHKISSTTKRLEKTQIISEFLKEIPEKESSIIYLLLGEIYPEHDERKIGISTQLALKVISKATGTDSKKVMNEWKKIGDLGEVAEKLTKEKKQSTLHSSVLTTEKVLDNLRKLPELEGHGTVNKKMSLITELLTSASSIEAKFITRTILGDLRIGIQESTVRDSIAETFFSENKKEAVEKIQEAIDKSNNLAEIFQIARKKDLEEFEKIEMQAGKAIRVMLAQKVSSIEEGFSIVGKPCAVEYKYDGFRLVIHKKEDKVTLYTRRLENVTKQFPEVADYVKKFVKGNNFILDSEAVGFDKKTKRYTKFQDISQRIKRKYDIEKVQNELPIEVNVFDVLFYEGKSYLNEPFRKRTELVKKIVLNQPYKIICSKQIITDNEKKAQEFYEKALKENQEGVMMKNLDAIYKPGKRVGYMLKLKPESKDFDLVITGAEYGTGKRSGWFSSFILSCKNGNEFLEVGRVGTGIKEKTEEGVSFSELTEKIKPLITKEENKMVEIKPKIVVAVTYQEIQKSPTYSSGYALRFPRVTAIRNDKPLSEITTLDEIKKETT